ncbi:MAG: protein kinase [Bryobacteraceae bacterium]
MEDQATRLTNERLDTGGSLLGGALIASRFRIIRFLGAGSLGEVYEADDLELVTRVAIKAICGLSAEQIGDLYRNVEPLSRLSHPGVCRVFDVVHHVSEQGDALLLTTEFVEGETLAARLAKSGPLPPSDALEIFKHICEAAGAAHNAGLVHGNLRTRNVLLSRDSANFERHVVTDFALPVRPAAPFAAPEQLMGEPPSVAGDVYALGLLLYELLTGSLPFPVSADGSSQMRLPSVRTTVPSLDGYWDAAIARCLDPAPERRFQSADQLVETLESCVEATVTVAATEKIAPTGPRTWGPFQLLERLGAGGFGEVYRAWDPVLERDVALKLLLPRGLDSESEFQAIVREARAVAKVRHPNIVSVYGVDRHDGRVGFWSDFIRGHTLARLVAVEGAFAQVDTAAIGIEICRAVSAVHAAGLLHRDIKASNVMREDSGRLLLMDFGLSHELDRAAEMGGTPAYMAPELRRGEAASVASDVYALGVLLFYLATGDFPNAKLASSANLTSEFTQVVETAIHPDPSHRFASAALLSRALEPLAQKKKAAGKPVRHTQPALLIAGVAVAISVAAILVPRVIRHSGGQSAFDMPDDSSYTQAANLLARYDQPGNTRKAIDLMQKAVQSNPNSPLDYAQLANARWRMYLDTGELSWRDEAQQAAAKAVSLNPQLAPVQMAIGTVDVGTGKLDQGIEHLLKAQQLAPTSAAVSAALSEGYRLQGRTDEARQALQRAIDLDFNDWRWPYLLGALDIDSGKLADAEQELKKAGELAPHNARVLLNLGKVYGMQGRYADSERVLMEAKALAPTYGIYWNLGTTLQVQGKYKQAAEMFRHAAALSPDSYEVWGNLGSAYLWNGQKAEARTAFEKAIALAEKERKTRPGDADLVANLALYYADLGDRQRSLPLIREALALAPSRSDIVYDAGEASELLGRRKEALEYIANALELGFSPEYIKVSPELAALRKDPQAPARIR